MNINIFFVSLCIKNMFLTDNKSLGAFDDDNDDQLCGVQINSSSYFVPDIDLEKYLLSVSQKTQNLIRFDHFLQKEMMNKFCGNNYIGGYWISVNAPYSGRGVGHQLVTRCMKWLTTNFRDFDSLVAVTTAPESKHITEKIGFKSTYEMKMSEYKDEKTGERIFANAGVPFVYLMVKLRNVTNSNL
ncbi:unnamed protein product [Clavelina lepadiformis]|uniref:N-acetyltransferase domain-containing protein n=1 Tax=Clavelina lepadiformis TaxID=159417 RepID=A0ABP0FGG0_CLALP